MARIWCRHISTGGRRRIAALLAAALALLAVPVVLGAAQAAPGQRIDLKVLVLAPTADDSVAAAWRSALDGEGVPNDVRVLNAGTPDLADADLADYGANRAYYQAVIVAWGDMPMTDGERAAVNRLQTTFGIRKLSDNKRPGSDVGMNAPTHVGEQGGGSATLTDAGRALFPYLHGTVPIDAPAFGYRATPLSPAYTRLLSGPGNASYLGVFTHPDGRQEMVSALTGGRFQTHHQLLRHGVISWLTGGVFLGHRRNYFAMQVDDIFMPNDRWDVNRNQTGVDEPTSSPDEYRCDREPGGFPDCLPPIRMTPADVTRLVQWQNANGVRLDMLFNGHGSDEAIEEAAQDDDPNTNGDPLTEAFLPQRSRFYWMNHTYSHPKLYSAPRAAIVNEITWNVHWAAARGIPIDPAELVTGEHSGLDNPDMAGALADTGVRWIGSDNSREPNQRTIGPATTVPRYPSNVYYNVGTQAEQLDEYNHIYLRPPNGKCVDTATNTCLGAPANWSQYVASEANIMFDHVMDNDARPHYAHQSNLAEDGTLYPVLDAVLARYRPYVNVPLVQLTHTQIGEELGRRAQWNANRGGVSAYLQDGQVHLSNTTPRAVSVPITGTSVGEVYGGQRSGWVTVPGRATESTPIPGPRPGVEPVRVSLSEVTVKPKRFPVRGRRRGATLSWRVSHAGTLRIGVERRVRGRKVGRTCQKQTRRNRRRRACWRYESVGTIARSARAGSGRFRFTGKVGRRVLKTGSHRFVVTASGSDRSTLPSAARGVAFTVVKARRR